MTADERNVDLVAEKTNTERTMGEYAELYRKELRR